MESTLQRTRAEALRALHHRSSPLILPNAWDVAGASIFARTGFQALGTTSAGIAAALGYPDGQHLLREGTYASMLAETIPYAEVTALLSELE